MHSLAGKPALYHCNRWWLSVIVSAELFDHVDPLDQEAQTVTPACPKGGAGSAAYELPMCSMMYCVQDK
jgi:hypothetical protein